MQAAYFSTLYMHDREYCAKLESQGDDELLIGKLQRQLMSTKTSYKTFVRKFQYLRGNMRQRELAMRCSDIVI